MPIWFKENPNKQSPHSSKANHIQRNEDKRNSCKRSCIVPLFSHTFFPFSFITSFSVLMSSPLLFIRWGASQVLFFFCFVLQWANLIGPSLKKKRNYGGSPKYKVLFWSIEFLSFGPPIIGERRDAIRNSLRKGFTFHLKKSGRKFLKLAAHYFWPGLIASNLIQNGTKTWDCEIANSWIPFCKIFTFVDAYFVRTSVYKLSKNYII